MNKICWKRFFTYERYVFRVVWYEYAVYGSGGGLTSAQIWTKEFDEVVPPR